MDIFVNLNRFLEWFEFLSFEVRPSKIMMCKTNLDQAQFQEHYVTAQISSFDLIIEKRQKSPKIAKI